MYGPTKSRALIQNMSFFAAFLTVLPKAALNSSGRKMVSLSGVGFDVKRCWLCIRTQLYPAVPGAANEGFSL